MPVPVEKTDARLMRAMFAAIATRYDFVTRLFSYGMDIRWKRRGVRGSGIAEGARVLDLAAGTGDFSRLVLEHRPRARVVAFDLTEPMLHAARQRGVPNAVCGDSGALPFTDAAFDCVFVGYGLRNFPFLAEALAEMARVTRPGGCIVSLDFFLPPNGWYRRCYLTYLYAQGAFWGLLLHRRARTYTYIPESLKSFTSIAGLSAMLECANFHRIRTHSFLWGGIGLHWATRQATLSSC